MLVERFKSVVDYRKNITTTSQKQIAKEICLNSKVEIGLNQSMISKIYNGTDIPK
ncbi:2403_t:CDS:1, partial [Entrophospora sp. SA101]